MTDLIQEKWTSLEKIAEYLDVSKDTIRVWIKNNKIPAHKIGKQWKFKISEVDEWIFRGKAGI
jgi:excisionase family DNA binding protein